MILWMLQGCGDAPEPYRWQLFVYDDRSDAEADLRRWSEEAGLPEGRCGHIFPCQYVGRRPRP